MASLLEIPPLSFMLIIAFRVPMSFNILRAISREKMYLNCVDHELIFDHSKS